MEEMGIAPKGREIIAGKIQVLDKTKYNLIESLKADLATLQRQLRDMSSSNVADPSQEAPPPHY